MSEIQQLRDTLTALKLPYGTQSGMEEVNSERWKTIVGPAFFPVGRGLLTAGDETVSNKPVMVLGQDFGTAGYTKNLPAEGESLTASPTWKNLLALIEKAGASSKDCFFTNAIMGVRLGEGSKMTGMSPAFRDADFLKGCRKFFLQQVEMQKPKVILALGKQVVEFLADSTISQRLAEVWTNRKSFSELICNDQKAVIEQVFFEKANHEATIVVLLHPSFRAVNEAKLCKSDNATFTVDTESARISQAYLTT